MCPRPETVYGVTHTSNPNGIHGICNTNAPWWVSGQILTKYTKSGFFLDGHSDKCPFAALGRVIWSLNEQVKKSFFATW